MRSAVEVSNNRSIESASLIKFLNNSANIMQWQNFELHEDEEILPSSNRFFSPINLYIFIFYYLYFFVFLFGHFEFEYFNTLFICLFVSVYYYFFYFFISRDLLRPFQTCPMCGVQRLRACSAVSQDHGFIIF